MDLKSLLAKAGVPNEIKRPSFPVKVVTPSPEKIVQPTNDQPKEVCACGHPEDAHDEEGICEILECDCQSWCPPSHSYDINAVAQVLDNEQSESRLQRDPVPPPKVVTMDVAIIDEELLNAIENKTSEQLTKIDEVLAVIPSEVPKEEEELLPEPSTESMPDGYCQHLCENSECLRWWTHGLSKDCKYPDILKQGLCQKCNTNGETFQIKPEEDIKDGKLTAPAQIKCRNDERVICKNMNIEQLTRHIEYHAVRIAELHIRSLEARKMRAELEEEELQHIPESEREAFIQALRRGDKEGKTKKVRASKPKLETAKSKEAALVAGLKAQGKSSEEAKTIAAMMVKTGKSQAEVEAWLND